MRNEIKVSHGEALDLLQKWLEEKRVIHLSITADGVLVKLPGRLDEVSTERFQLSLTKSTFAAGPYALVNVSLSDCTFEYSDAEHAPEPLRAQLKGYEALLYIFRNAGTVQLGLAVLPLSEWLQL